MSGPDDDLVGDVRRHGDLGLTAPDPGAVDRIAAAASQRAGAARARRHWLPFVIGGAVVVGVAGAATAATGVWRPQVGDDVRGRPSISATLAPREQLDHLAVLRRPQDDRDRGADVRRVLRRVGRSYRGVRTASVRRVVVPGGGGPRIIVPAVRANGFDDALCLYIGGGSSCVTTDEVLSGKSTFFTVREAPPTAAQRRANRRAGEQATRRVRARKRAALRRLGPLPRDRAARRRVLKRAYATEDLNGVDFAYVLPRAIDTRFYGIVPDGVAQVVRTDEHGRHATTVQQNTYRLVVPGRAEGPGVVTWLDAQGRTIRTIQR